MVEGYSSKRWLVCPKPNSQASLRLFCFPYAGGGIPVFRGWSDILPPLIEVWVANLPGRGAFIRQPSFNNMRDLVQSLTEAFCDELWTPFAFFGHSLGALVSFELARTLRRAQSTLPVGLFLAGHGAPQLPNLAAPLYNIPEDEFIEAIRRLKGTPPEVFENKELLRLSLPALRADFEVNETYQYQEERPLDCPIYAYGGLQDPLVTKEHLLAWRHQTTMAFSLKMIPGDHFFLQNSQSKFMSNLSGQLEQLAESLKNIYQ